jgi:hypothetical protein
VKLRVAAQTGLPTANVLVTLSSASVAITVTVQAGDAADANAVRVLNLPRGGGARAQGQGGVWGLLCLHRAECTGPQLYYLRRGSSTHCTLCPTAADEWRRDVRCGDGCGRGASQAAATLTPLVSTNGEATNLIKDAGGVSFVVTAHPAHTATRSHPHSLHAG